MPADIGYATDGAQAPLSLRDFDRAPVGPEDMQIDIACCGVCHSGVHRARDEFGGALATAFPCRAGPRSC